MSKLTAKEVLQRYRDEWLPDFLDIDLKNVNQAGRFGNTPLHLSSVRGDIEELEALLSAGADVKAAGEHRYTPLHDAVAQGHEKAVKLLLRSGASLEQKNDFGQTARDVAEIGKKSKILEVLSSGV